MELIMAPALLVLLSAFLRGLIVDKGGTRSIMANIGLGLPVDLTFAMFAIVLYVQVLNKFWSQHHVILIVGILLIPIVQLGLIYKPCKEYRDESENLKAFGLWFLNMVITFILFSYILLGVIK